MPPELTQTELHHDEEELLSEGKRLAHYELSAVVRARELQYKRHADLDR